MPEGALLVCAATAAELAHAAPGLVSEDGLRELTPVPVRLKGRPALFCVTGVGPVNAALAMGFCFGLTSGSGGEAGQPAGGGLRIGAVLNVGLAGAFDLAATPLRALCLVEEEIWPEYGLNDGTSVTARAFSYPLWRKADGAPEDVYDRVRLAPAEALGAREPAPGAFLPRRSLTVAGVSASFARAREMANRHRAELENMEGFAVAYACARAGVPCVEVRAVSNKVGPRAADEKDFPGALAALAGVLPALGLA
ncbi:MAG: futalosine hydrolase [Desulfovibrio sp.]|uniref:futalosine hydrolase n=1 Tax=Desulfovibrio sp. TaxID=885 RepID=UPI001A6CBFE4|nr:futalosine hydrolase [Desulfovibrio sp.]MBD5416663.1 futalosine hydrolase [Desulfovibrio sp.]